MKLETMGTSIVRGSNGKAVIQCSGDTAVLYSYETPVAAFVDGKVERLWGGYSATTMRHVRAFIEWCGLNYKVSKSWWDNMEVMG